MDTFVIHNNQSLQKPTSQQDAYEKLKQIQGKTTDVVSGIAILNEHKKIVLQDHHVTKITLARLTDQEILDYIATGDPFNKAGAFGLLTQGSFMIESIQGCPHNAAGFPVHKIYVLFKSIGINMLKGKVYQAI